MDLNRYLPGLPGLRPETVFLPVWFEGLNPPVIVPESGPPPDQDLVENPPSPEEDDSDPWDDLFPEDYVRITKTPSLRFDPPCPWCGRRNGHHWLCEQQRAEWATMPWGKYKNRQITEVPEDYLKFVLIQMFGTSDDRKMLLEELQRIQPGKYRGPFWESYAE